MLLKSAASTSLEAADFFIKFNDLSATYLYYLATYIPFKLKDKPALL